MLCQLELDNAPENGNNRCLATLFTMCASQISILHFDLLKQEKEYLT